MKKQLWSCLTFGLLTAATFAHTRAAVALEPVSLADGDLDRVTAGAALDLRVIQIIDSTLARTLETILADGSRATSSIVISCDNCTASVLINHGTGLNAVVVTSSP